MSKKELSIIIYTIVILLSVMYATQPLQPLLAQEFQISMVEASSFTAVIMLFLAISPIIYGYILESISAKKVLLSASLILLITNIILSLSQNFMAFLTARCVEAIVIPAILTACMSLLAQDKHRVKVNMSIYVAATVFGGLIGRVMSGAIATEFGWRMVFFSLSLALLVGIFLIRQLPFDNSAKLIKPTLKDGVMILQDRRFVVIYILMFTVFFVFAGLLNILPFMIKTDFPQISEAEIGLLYMGYGMGIVVSLMIHKIVKIVKNELYAILTGLSIFILSTICFVIQSPLFLFALVFLFCFGMFIIHTVATRVNNSLKQNQKGITSGMYLSFYYIGGAIGSIIPPLLYTSYGWAMTIYTFTALLVMVLGFVWINRRLFI